MSKLTDEIEALEATNEWDYIDFYDIFDKYFPKSFTLCYYNSENPRFGIFIKDEYGPFI